MARLQLRLLVPGSGRALLCGEMRRKRGFILTSANPAGLTRYAQAPSLYLYNSYMKCQALSLAAMSPW